MGIVPIFDFREKVFIVFMRFTDEQVAIASAKFLDIDISVRTGTNIVFVFFRIAIGKTAGAIQVSVIFEIIQQALYDIHAVLIIFVEIIAFFLFLF